MRRPVGLNKTRSIGGAPSRLRRARFCLKRRVNPADIAAVTFSGQMMGIVPIDAAGQPLRSAIIWADQRAVEEAETIGTAVRAGEISIAARGIA